MDFKIVGHILGGVGFGQNIALGGAHQKCDIVDTKTHASARKRPNRYKQTGFPTTWREAGKAKRKKEIRLAVIAGWLSCSQSLMKLSVSFAHAR